MGHVSMWHCVWSTRQRQSGPCLTHRYHPKIYVCLCSALCRYHGLRQLWCRTSELHIHDGKIDIPDCETMSMSLPSRINSSFCDFDSVIVTPFNMPTCRTVYRIVNKEQIGLLRYPPSRPGSSGFLPWLHHFGWYSWWGSEHIQPAFCIGNPVGFM